MIKKMLVGVIIPFVLISLVLGCVSQENRANMYLDKGIAFDQKSNSDKAILEYTKAIEIKPDFAVAYNNRGFVYHKKGDFDKAMLDFTKAIEIKPDAAVAYYGRGLVYIMTGAFEKAISDFNKALKYNPHDKDAQGALAFAKKALKKK